MNIRRVEGGRMTGRGSVRPAEEIARENARNQRILAAFNQIGRGDDFDDAVAIEQLLSLALKRKGRQSRPAARAAANFNKKGKR